MKYKGIILDLDGTTVEPFTTTVTPRVKDAIHAVRDTAFVSIATGRLLHGALPATAVLEQLDIKGLCVVNNGSVLYDPVAKEIVKMIHLEQKNIPELTSILQHHAMDYHIFDGEEEYPHDHLQDFEKIVSFYVPNQPEAKILALEESLRHIPEIAIHRMTGKGMGNQSLEICHAEATKQYGVFEVFKTHNLKSEEMIGCGDSYNDFPLLMACGLKIAMGNAVPELKAIADFVAPPVEEDGVATVIEKFLL